MKERQRWKSLLLSPSSDRLDLLLIFGEVFASADLAFPLVDDLSILQKKFNIRGVLLLALWTPHVRHSGRFPRHESFIQSEL